MLCVHDSHFVLEVEYVNCTVADTDKLEVIKHLPHCHPCIKGNRLTHLGIPCLIKFIEDEAFCLYLRRLESIPVGDAGAMYGFGYGADHTGRSVGY